MEKISDLLNVESLTVAKEERQEKPFCPHAIEIINKIFALFYALCRGFDKQYSDPNRLAMEKTQWIRTFTELGIKSLEQIKLGEKKVRIETPVNTPSLGEFLKWCKPSAEDLGLMTPNEAYEKAFVIISPYNKDMVHDDISPDQLAIIKHAIKNTGSWDMRNLAKSKTLPIFVRNYEIAIRQFNEGRLNSIPKAILDETKETIELEKQKLVADKFERLNSYEKAMPWIKNILGMDLGDVIPK